MKQMLFATSLAILIAFFTACPTGTNENPVSEANLPENNSPAPNYQWVQFGENGAVLARAIYKQKNQTCPNIETTDNNNARATIAMQTRATVMPENFTEITVCEAAIKDSDKLKSASLGGKNLHLPTKDPKRFVVLGDTGCRIKITPKYSDIQNCRDDSEAPTNGNASSAQNPNDGWNFRKTINSAVKLDNTDLVIHVGDYVYRESECPADKAKECGGSPFGPKWETWETDFFEPAAPLLEATPWVFARGNHEDCKREWTGWYLFLDPRPLTDTSLTQCNPHTDPLKVSLNDLELLVLDSSDEQGLNQNDIDNLKGVVPLWVITHVPFYSISAYGNSSPLNNNPPKEKDSELGKEVLAAIKQPNVSFLVSGHVHLFEMIQFKDGDERPAQMIAGGGATELDPEVGVSTFQGGLDEFNADPAKSEVLDDFTFTYIDSAEDDWKVTVIDQDGTTEKKTFTVEKDKK